MKPHAFANFSLPPAIRWQPKYMLTTMVLPESIKNHTQKKYFDFMAKYDLQKLWTQGVGGVKVKVFATSMDTPGRADLLVGWYNMHVCFVVISKLIIYNTHANRDAALPSISKLFYLYPLLDTGT